MHRKPVKFLTNGGRDVIVLPYLENQTCNGMKDGLQWSEMNCTGTIEDTVAIVDSTWNGCVHQRLCRIPRQKTANRTELPKLVEANVSSPSSTTPKQRTSADTGMLTPSSTMLLMLTFVSCTWVHSQFYLCSISIDSPSSIYWSPQCIQPSWNSWLVQWRDGVWRKWKTIVKICRLLICKCFVCEKTEFVLNSLFDWKPV